MRLISREEYGFDQFRRLREDGKQHDMHCESKNQKDVRNAVRSAFQTLNLNNEVESIYKHVGQETWEVHFSGDLDGNQREAVVAIAADKLELRLENIILCGFFPKSK